MKTHTHTNSERNGVLNWWCSCSSSRGIINGLLFLDFHRRSFLVIPVRSKVKLAKPCFSRIWEWGCGDRSSSVQYCKKWIKKIYFPRDSTISYSRHDSVSCYWSLGYQCDLEWFCRYVSLNISFDTAEAAASAGNSGTAGAPTSASFFVSCQSQSQRDQCHDLTAWRLRTATIDLKNVLKFKLFKTMPWSSWSFICPNIIFLLEISMKA